MPPRLPDAVWDTRERTVRALWRDMTSAAIGGHLGMHAADVRKLAARLGLQPRRTGRPPAGIHGSYAEWIRGCRCQPCVDASREHKREYRAKVRGRRAPVVRALATRLNNNGKPPMGPPPTPTAWRCPCDGYRVNPGDVTTCPSCGTVPAWATTSDQRRIS